MYCSNWTASTVMCRPWMTVVVIWLHAWRYKLLTFDKAFYCRNRAICLTIMLIVYADASCQTLPVARNSSLLVAIFCVCTECKGTDSWPYKPNNKVTGWKVCRNYCYWRNKLNVRWSWELLFFSATQMHITWFHLKICCLSFSQLLYCRKIIKLILQFYLSIRWKYRYSVDLFIFLNHVQSEASASSSGRQRLSWKVPAEAWRDSNSAWNERWHSSSST